MMKMEFDVRELSDKERAHVASFITNWPDQAEPGVTENTILQAEQDRDLREVQPGVVEVSPFIPKPPTVAHSFADAAASMIAQEGIRETTSATLNVPPPPVVPSAPPVPTAAQATGNPVVLDKHGLPWDSRIHASTKTFIADGSWKLRRGVEPEQVRIVTEELTKLMRIPVMVETVVPAPPPVPASIDQSITVTSTPVISLTELIGRMSAAIAAGILTQAQVAATCNKFGVSEFALLSSRPDLLPLIDGEMKALGV